MKNLIKIKKIDIISFLVAATMVIACFEKGPMMHKIGRTIYVMVNSCFGYPFFNKTFYVFLTDLFILAITFFSFNLFKVKLKNFFFEKPKIFFLAFVFFVFCSIIFSLYKACFYQFFWAFNFFMMFLFISSISSVLNKQNIKRFLNVVFMGLLIISLIESFLGIYQYFSQSALGYKIFHEINFTLNNAVAAKIRMPGGFLSIFDYLLNIKREANVLLRSCGTFSHANVFGGVMFFLTISTFYFYLISKKRLIKAFLSFVLFFQVFAMFTSFSRSAIFAFILMNIVFYLLILIKKIKKERVYKQLLIISFIACLFSFIILAPQIIQRGGVVNYNNHSKNSDIGRLSYQKVSYNMIKTHPYFGIGFNYFYPCVETFAKNEKVFAGTVHNIFLLIAAENGLFALLAFLIFIFYVYKIGWQKKRNIDFLFLAFFTSLLFIGCCDFYLIYLPLGKIVLFFPAAVLISKSS